MELLRLVQRPRMAGLLLLLLGLSILIAKLIYDISAQTAQARREFRILSENGLISDTGGEKKDRLLISSIEKSRRSGKLDFSSLKKNETHSGDAPAKQKETGGSPDSFMTVSLEPQFAEDHPAPADEYDTVSLER